MVFINDLLIHLLTYLLTWSYRVLEINFSYRILFKYRVCSWTYGVGQSSGLLNVGGRVTVVVRTVSGMTPFINKGRRFLMYLSFSVPVLSRYYLRRDYRDLYVRVFKHTSLLFRYSCKGIVFLTNVVFCTYLLVHRKGRREGRREGPSSCVYI